MGTFITSVAGVVLYSIIPAHGGPPASPDWLLGSLFGAGGFVGISLGARLQKFVPQKFIRLLLGVMILFIAASYILQFLFS